jgi:putative spermidine/putrescine transport system substrate-binding protein
MTVDRSSQAISRRELLARARDLGLLAAGVGTLSALSAACAPSTGSGGSSSEEVNLTHFIWVGGGQGVVPREVVPAYEKAHPNVHVELYEGTNAVTYPKMVAAKEADPTKPLINFGFYNVDATVKGAKDDMWVSLDEAKIPNMKGVFPGFKRPDNKGIGWGMSAIGLIYNKNMVKQPPTSWLDLLDPAYKGKVVAFDYGFNLLLLPIAYAMGGSSKNDEDAWKELTRAAKDKQFLAFGGSNEDVKNPIVRGDAWIAPWFSSQQRVWEKEEGAPVGYVIPKEGQEAFPLYFQIVKGSTPRQIEVASEILNQYLDPTTLGRYCDLTKSIPARGDVKLSAELQADPAFAPAAIEKAIQVDWDTAAERDAEWRRRWDRDVKAVM